MSNRKYALIVVIVVAIVQAVFLWADRFGDGTKRFICGVNMDKIVKNDSSNSGLLRANSKPESKNADEQRPQKDLIEEEKVQKTDDTKKEDADQPKKQEETNEKATKKEMYYRPPEKPSSYPNEFEGVWGRPYEPWPQNRSIPCFEPEEKWRNPETQQTPTDEGFLFLKPFKTGSSTASGVNLRISRNVAQRQKKDFDICKARYDHAWANRLFSKRDPQKAFLWTIVRDPTKRIVSQFFHFEVSRNKKEPSDANFFDYVLKSGPRDMIRNYYMEAIALQQFKPSETTPADHVNKILEDYNFVGITERMDESLVAMAMLLGVPIGDVLYLKAKGHGGYDDGGGRDSRICTYIWPSFISQGMEDFFKTDEWQDIVHWDHVFYQAANRSLDLTIEKFGRDKFEENFSKYQRAKTAAHERCLPKTTFPCSPGGDYTPPDQTDCLWNDSGCGNTCLDQIATEFNL